MLTFLERLNTCPKATISFLYHDNGKSPMPKEYSDPLTLLGDIKLLKLSPAQQDELRSAVRNDLSTAGAEEIWRTRAFRKNVIHSFGSIV
ncbi:hypothetical protein LN040_00585 [Desulfovibrio subterraneus]|jgi:hypothetical protein|uniref:Uncharacterized protein n=1 Tax=Desulfovibrio subterraneus TaxID=2718620 RepID=A0A7J0BJT0_9BACT|nr:hypothetical protein [Desulfovibrio subterraneus]WBF67640.1 hypothetical protein LN040_00585 [Desulfovibrio subterraneus]GFM33471.1 hypothetical protein DSM101010T_18360 [Desulfovibrio subterraneus]